jgi:hypothetical protein
MSKRVINDPAALGWVYDPKVDRWRWDGGDGSGSCDDLEPRVAALEYQIDAGDYNTKAQK